MIRGSNNDTVEPMQIAIDLEPQLTYPKNDAGWADFTDNESRLSLI
jgi:hypothetical protein